MLYLVTGTPGQGKTLNTIKYIHETKTFQKIGDKKRDIYYYNIRDLDASFGWIELTEEQAKNWYNLPPGSVLVFDEAYTIFPARPGGSKPSVTTEKLATHRHQGFDIFLITQKAQGQVDAFVRGLVGRHQHYARIFGSKNVNRYTWEFCQLNVDSRSAKQLANVSTVRLDRRYFGKYHSADEHTHQSNLPWRTISIIFFGIFLVVFFFYRAFDTFTSSTENDSPDSSVASSSSVHSGSAHSISRERMTFSQLHTPDVKSLPWSAPVYSSVTEAKTWPRPAACYYFSADDCRCFTQQATRLYLDNDVCLSIVKNGFFDWTKDSYSSTSRLRIGVDE